MLLERAPQPFADSGWLYQVKWDGVRNLTLVDGGEIRHWSRRLRERTRLFPELNGLARAVGGRRVVLDGEIIVLKGGKPSFSAILERDVAGKVPSAQKVHATPATLMIFDLLEHGETQLYSRPLEKRLALLEQLVRPDEAWQVVTSFPGGAGSDLYQAVAAQDLEGVVAKRLGSPYRPGTRTRDWLKIKRRRRMLAVVCGYTAPVGRPGGLLLGAYQGERLVYIGRVGSGISGGDLATLKAHLPPGPEPFHPLPTLRDRFSGPPGPVVWTEPRLTVQVEFSELTEEQRLRDPVLIGFATEPPEAARLP